MREQLKTTTSDTAATAQNSTESAEGATVDFNSKEWWNIAIVAKILHVDYTRLVRMADLHLRNHPKWLTPTKHGVNWHRDLVLLLKKEEKENREIPKDWKTVTNLSEVTGYPAAPLRNVFHAVAKDFPDAKNHVKTVNSAKEIYYSPEICNALIKQLELYPLVTRQVQSDFRFWVPNDDPELKNIVQILEESGRIVRGKFFTSTKTGKIVEHFPNGSNAQKEIANYIRETKDK